MHFILFCRKSLHRASSLPLSALSLMLFKISFVLALGEMHHRLQLQLWRCSSNQCLREEPWANSLFLLSLTFRVCVGACGLSFAGSPPLPLTVLAKWREFLMILSCSPAAACTDCRSPRGGVRWQILGQLGKAAYQIMSPLHINSLKSVSLHFPNRNMWDSSCLIVRKNKKNFTILLLSVEVVAVQIVVGIMLVRSYLARKAWPETRWHQASVSSFKEYHRDVSAADF